MTRSIIPIPPFFPVFSSATSASFYEKALSVKGQRGGPAGLRPAFLPPNRQLLNALYNGGFESGACFWLRSQIPPPLFRCNTIHLPRAEPRTTLLPALSVSASLAPVHVGVRYSPSDAANSAAASKARKQNAVIGTRCGACLPPARARLATSSCASSRGRDHTSRR